MFTLVAQSLTTQKRSSKMRKIETILRSLYGSSIMEQSLRGAAVSPVDRQKYIIYSRKSSAEKRRCINKTAAFARA